MKKLTTIIFLTCLVLLTVQGQGILRESLTLSSKILKKEVEYSIYLPYDYELSDRKYPVLYLLHGYTDDEIAWIQFGEIKTIVDQQIGNSQVTPMIIAMPDAGVDWYINSFDGKTMYEDFFIEEFVPYIESNYRGRGEKQFRAVAGLSMGGHGTLIYAMKHPDMFAAAAPLSAAIWPDQALMDFEDEQWNTFFGFIFGSDLKGEDRFTDHLKQNTVLALAEQTDPEELKKVKYYIDCGDDDFLIKGNMEFHALLIDKEVPHEFRVRDGAHNWTYWRTALPEVLKFVSQGFHR